MKRYPTILLLLLIASQSFGAGYLPCKLIYNERKVQTGYAKIPEIKSAIVKFKENMDSKVYEIPSDDLYQIVFTQDNKDFYYERILTYKKNFEDIRVSEDKSWLKILKTGYMSLYFGYEMDSPSSSIWYFKKAGDPMAYYISEKFGIWILTVDSEYDFRENASFYFGDYKELADKILNSEYKFKDIELVVDLYNSWHDNK